MCRFLQADMRDKVDIVLSHIPPVIGHWGSSERFLKALLARKVRAVLFGHVHA